MSVVLTTAERALADAAMTAGTDVVTVEMSAVAIGAGLALVAGKTVGEGQPSLNLMKIPPSATGGFFYSLFDIIIDISHSIML